MTADTGREGGLRWYRVQIRGRNFLLDIDGEVSKQGFRTTRYVEARSPDEAGDLACRALREERNVDAFGGNAPEDPPWLEAEEVEQIPSLDDVRSLRPGLAWSPEDEDEDEGENENGGEDGGSKAGRERGA